MRYLWLVGELGTCSTPRIPSSQLICPTYLFPSWPHQPPPALRPDVKDAEGMRAILCDVLPPDLFIHTFRWCRVGQINLRAAVRGKQVRAPAGKLRTVHNGHRLGVQCDHDAPRLPPPPIPTHDYSTATIFDMGTGLLPRPFASTHCTTTTAGASMQQSCRPSLATQRVSSRR